MKQHYDIIVVGGGAAGFFVAVNIAEHATVRILIVEQSKEVLSKVRISGGGRCNVTHACFDPKTLTNYYPRGNKELLGPFHRFDCSSTVTWFEERGVLLKTENDGRMFPVTDDSASIIECLMRRARQNNIEIKYNTKVKHLEKINDHWSIKTEAGNYEAPYLIVATGSSNFMWDILQTLGHNIIEAVPSLFTFHIKDKRLYDLMGLSVPNANVAIKGTNIVTNGPLLITHWGLSGPAILKASAWAARELSILNYSCQVIVDWISDFSEEQLLDCKKTLASKSVMANAIAPIPNRLWKSLVAYSEIPDDMKWADLNKEKLNALIATLKRSEMQLSGKSIFKEEFVTAGGVDLKQIDFKNFESKVHPNLFMAGEVLNIDAVTGGFNFQAAWTGGYIIAEAVLNRING